MCGIAGIIAKEGNYARSVENMLRAQAHRRRDDSGFIAFEGGAAGAVRLALVNLSERGQQPIWSPDGRVANHLTGKCITM